MGSATNILIIMTVISVGLLFFGFDSGATTLFKFLNVNTATGEITEGTQLIAQLLALLSVTFATGIATALTLYAIGQGQYAIFGGIVTWLMTFAFLPLTILTRPEIPIMVKTIIGAPVVMLYILALIQFFRGAEL